MSQNLTQPTGSQIDPLGRIYHFLSHRYVVSLIAVWVASLLLLSLITTVSFHHFILVSNSNIGSVNPEEFFHPKKFLQWHFMESGIDWRPLAILWALYIMCLNLGPHLVRTLGSDFDSRLSSMKGQLNKLKEFISPADCLVYLLLFISLLTYNLALVMFILFIMQIEYHISIGSIDTDNQNLAINLVPLMLPVITGIYSFLILEKYLTIPNLSPFQHKYSQIIVYGFWHKDLPLFIIALLLLSILFGIIIFMLSPQYSQFDVARSGQLAFLIFCIVIIMPLSYAIRLDMEYPGSTTFSSNCMEISKVINSTKDPPIQARDLTNTVWCSEFTNVISKYIEFRDMVLLLFFTFGVALLYGFGMCCCSYFSSRRPLPE